MLRGFFEPEVVLIAGASREPGKVGYALAEVMKSYKDRGIFKGRLYATNPKPGPDILGIPTFRSVMDLPEVPDLAVIVTPAKFVNQVAEECGIKGVRNIVVISGGFAEVGEEGRKLQEELVSICRKYNMRLIGPNCVGVLVPRHGLDTLFLPVDKEFDGDRITSLKRPEPGRISLITQSGAFGVACLDYMYGEGIGLAKFVSYGNKADVDEVELIEYLGDDEETRVILVYAESIDRGREFLRKAGEVSKKKPIVVFKAGRTKTGAAAASSHTAAIAGSDSVYEAAFKQAGVLRAYDMEQFFDMAKALSMQPPARGDRIAVITDGGGAGVMATDAVELSGMRMARFSDETFRKLDEMRRSGIIPGIASIKNPIDLTGSATDESFVESLKAVAEDSSVDGVVMIALHHVPGVTSELPRKIAAVDLRGKPMVVVDIGGEDYAVKFRREFEKAGFPAYPEPERGVNAMKALVEYGRYFYRWLDVPKQ
ncbi:MAG: CoA-binding protein [Thermoproteota archaeon]|nr:MAG: CoA-binding protein [Candidatus Korarchaeota archaeon]